jgi:hypothetical protein
LLGEPIDNLGRPWWFINMWLDAHMHKHLQRITNWQKLNQQLVHTSTLAKPS